MKRKIYEILRKQVAIMATGKKGKCEILDNEIICYVDGKRLKKKKKYDHRYNLIFHCIPSKEELYKIYRVDKPVHYIVKDVTFDMEVNIQASIKKCHVTFENCTFKEALGIDFADHITFINNKYEARDHKKYFSLVPEGHFYISTRADKNEINKIEFLNDNITVEDIKTIPMIKANERNKKINRTKKSIIKLWVYGKEVKFENTNIANAESIEIGTDTLILNDTNISSKEIEISSSLIEATNETIDTDIISIENNNETNLNRINANIVFINGVEIDKNQKVLEVHELELQKQRLKLIDSLRKVKNISEDSISNKLKEIKLKIQKQPVKKLIKQK